MTSEEFNEWMRKLRSGKYTKIRGSMGQDGCYCALGVYLNECSKNKAKLDRFKDINKPLIFDSIAHLNDMTEMDLPQIADYIEANYRSAFVKDQR